MAPPVIAATRPARLQDSESPLEHVFSRISYVSKILAFAFSTTSSGGDTSNSVVRIEHILQLATLNSTFRQTIQQYLAPEVWARALRHPNPSARLLSRMAKHGDCSWALAAMTVKGRWSIANAQVSVDAGENNESSTSGGAVVSFVALVMKHGRVIAATNAVRLGAHLTSRDVCWLIRNGHAAMVADVLFDLLMHDSTKRRPTYTVDAFEQQGAKKCDQSGGRSSASATGASSSVFPMHVLLESSTVSSSSSPSPWRLVLAILRHRFWYQTVDRAAKFMPRTEQLGRRDPASRNEDGHTPLGVAIVSKDRAEIIHWAAATELQLRLGRPPGEDLRFDPKHLLCMQGIHVGGKYTPMQHALLVAADVELAEFLGTVIGDGSLLDERTCRALLEEAMALAKENEEEGKFDNVIAYVEKRVIAKESM